MSAADPVAVLADCADMLPLGSHGAQVLNRCALGLAYNRDAEWVDRVLMLEMASGAGDGDERAAFALAREALAPGPGVEASHG